MSLVESCDTIRNGMIRMATPFNYPNGSKIDLFLGSESPLFESHYLTDLGNTTAYLLDMQIKPWATKKRKQIMADVCGSLGITHVGGEFRVGVESNDQIASAMVRLAQACIRITDIAFTQRNILPGGFKEDVEEFIASSDLRYDSDLSLAGQYENMVPMDFMVYGKKVDSFVLTLSSGIPGSAHTSANEVFRKWFDLADYRPTTQFVSVLDTRNNAFRPEDIARIMSLSTILQFPEQQEELRETLAA
jgi:hypothetical protein